MSIEDWILLGILGVAALALIMGVTSAAHRHSAKKAAALAEQNRSIGEIVGDQPMDSRSGEPRGSPSDRPRPARPFVG